MLLRLGLGKVSANLLLHVVDLCCSWLFVICCQRPNFVAFSMYNVQCVEQSTSSFRGIDREHQWLNFRFGQ